jgi:dienelactone hydrolase
VRSIRLSCRTIAVAILFGGISGTSRAEDQHVDLTAVLRGTKALTTQSDLAADMVAGIDRFLMRELEGAPARRERLWERDFSSTEAYLRSVVPHRQRFQKIIGAVDSRPRHVAMELVATTTRPSFVTRGDGYTVQAVRWPAIDGMKGEGLLLRPEAEPIAHIIALPDADWTPERLAGLSAGLPVAGQFARRLAENGCEVLVPLLIDRRDTFSGNPKVKMTNQPHREFIYRIAYEVGRHIIGYEVQKVLAAVDYFSEQAAGKATHIGVIGHGEGGLMALYSGAIDPRIEAVAVCGYFQARQFLWSEPIYRNVWSLVTEFGDAELASLIAPRTLIIEACQGPEVSGPPAPHDGRSGAAPGQLVSPPLDAVRAEFDRARPVYEKLGAAPRLQLTVSGGTGQPGCHDTLAALLGALGRRSGPPDVKPLGVAPIDSRKGFDPQQRLHRQFDQMIEFTQKLVRQSEFRRREFWSKADPSSVQRWQQTCSFYRQYLWEQVIGRLPQPSGPANPRSRLSYDEPKWRGYEVVLDVWPDVFAYGVLLVPKDLRPGERRPVVVCQHGLEGRPQDIVDPKVESCYHSYGAKLADCGFIVYAPQNPYIGGDRFRILQRKANPLKLSLFSFIIGQHERTLEWLASLPFVDAERIAFYGLSYGGKTAVRVPPIVERYCLSICSGDFNEWVLKNTTIDYATGYPLTGEYEMPEFDLGNTFNYAELAGLMVPRPFMVERGHDDGVALDEWVAWEYAKVRRLYDRLGLCDRTTIEFFNGPHEIHGQGTFEFLRHHLGWRR